MPTPAARQFRIATPEALDLSLVLRGIAALLVVWWHTWGYAVGIPSLAFLYIPGRLSVFLFFIISGYVISAGFADGRYGGTGAAFRVFWRNRVLRIYPLFLAVTVASLAILGARGLLPNLDAAFVARQLLMLQWWHDYTLVGVFWTLGVELQFYIVVPLLFAVQWMRGPNLWMGLAVYSVLLAYPVAAHAWFGASWDNRTVLGNLMHFQAGVLLLHVRRGIDARAAARGAGIPLISGAVGVLALLGASFIYHRLPALFWPGLGLLLVDAGGVALLVAHRFLEARRIGLTPITRALSLLGVLSYGLYAWHGLVLTYFPWFLDRFLPTLGVSLALAAVGYVLVERPCLRLKRPAAGGVQAPLASVAGPV